MTKPERPRIYYVVWETEEECVDGFKSGYISTEGGGNLYWHDNQIELVEKSALDEALRERDEYALKYSAIELANKEMSRNDHVTLGELLLELEQLKADYGTCDAERDTLKAEVKRLSQRLHEADRGSRVCYSCDKSGNDIKVDGPVYTCVCGYSWAPIVPLLEYENNRLRALCGELVGALDKTLLAACWFHEGPFGPSPELDDYKSAQQALAKARKELGEG